MHVWWGYNSSTYLLFLSILLFRLICASCLLHPLHRSLFVFIQCNVNCISRNCEPSFQASSIHCWKFLTLGVGDSSRAWEQEGCAVCDSSAVQDMRKFLYLYGVVVWWLALRCIKMGMLTTTHPQPHDWSSFSVETWTTPSAQSEALTVCPFSADFNSACFRIGISPCKKK